MESVLRGAAVYVFLLLVFRLTGRRSLAQITTFDFVLLLIVSEATQQALLGDDFSVTNAFVLIVTLLTLERAADMLAHRHPKIDAVVNDRPLVLVEDGRIHQDRMDRMRVGVDDVMEAARELHGLERFDQVKHAVLERRGTISVVPR